MEFEEDPWISNIRTIPTHPGPGLLHWLTDALPPVPGECQLLARENTMNSLLGLLRHWPGGFAELTRPPLNGRKGNLSFGKETRFTA